MALIKGDTTQFLGATWTQDSNHQLSRELIFPVGNNYPRPSIQGKNHMKTTLKHISINVPWGLRKNNLMRGGGKINLQGEGGGVLNEPVAALHRRGAWGVCQIGRNSAIRFRGGFHSMKLAKMDSIFRQSHGRDLIFEHLSKLGQYQPLGPRNSVSCFPAIDFSKVKRASDVCVSIYQPDPLAKWPQTFSLSIRFWISWGST